MNGIIAKTLRVAVEKTIILYDGDPTIWTLYEPAKSEKLEKEIERYMKHHGRKNNK